MLGTSVQSSVEVVDALIDLLDAIEPSHFTDFGCGEGELLLRLARRFPDLPCIGIELDSQALAVARTRLSDAQIENVSLIQGNVLDHLECWQDIAFLYLGGALNQKLGHALLASGSGEYILTARYPIVGAVSCVIRSTTMSTIFIYRQEDLARRVEWDCFATVVALPVGTGYLLSEAVRTNSEATIEIGLAQYSPEGGIQVRAHEIGLTPARPGIPVICDLLLHCSHDVTDFSVSVLELTALLDGVAATPIHTVVIVPVQTGTPQEFKVWTLDEIQRAIDVIRQ